MEAIYVINPEAHVLWYLLLWIYIIRVDMLEMHALLRCSSEQNVIKFVQRPRNLLLY